MLPSELYFIPDEQKNVTIRTKSYRIKNWASYFLVAGMKKKFTIQTSFIPDVQKILPCELIKNIIFHRHKYQI